MKWLEAYEIGYPIVRELASKYSAGKANTISKDDLISAGLLGLYDAFEKYDIDTNVPFGAYARIRINGSIVDELRRMDWLPRAVRGKVKKFNEFKAKFLVQNHREPKWDDIKGHLKLTKEEFEKIEKLKKWNFYSQVKEDTVKRYHHISQVAPCEYKETKQKVKSAIENLPEKEQQVIFLRFFDELAIKEISKVLDLSEGRISQLLKEGLNLLKKDMNLDADLFNIKTAA